MTTIYLSVSSGQGRARGNLYKRAKGRELSSDVAILVSFPYLDSFLRDMEHWETLRCYAVDSGAFSVMNSGRTIDLDEYMDRLDELLESPSPNPVDIFALDIIGDPRKSLENALRMKQRGFDTVIPTYHIQDRDPAILDEMAAAFSKIAIGGVARTMHHLKQQFCEWVFSRVWPKKVHGFGINSRRLLLSLPFHSVDASSWESGPCSWGVWAGIRAVGKLSWHGTDQNLTVEIEHYLKLEREVRQRWKRELTNLDP